LIWSPIFRFNLVCSKYGWIAKISFLSLGWAATKKICSSLRRSCTIFTITPLLLPFSPQPQPPTRCESTAMQERPRLVTTGLGMRWWSDRRGNAIQLDRAKCVGCPWSLQRDIVSTISFYISPPLGLRVMRFGMGSILTKILGILGTPPITLRWVFCSSGSRVPKLWIWWLLRGWGRCFKVTLPHWHQTNLLVLTGGRADRAHTVQGWKFPGKAGRIFPGSNKVILKEVLMEIMHFFDFYRCTETRLQYKQYNWSKHSVCTTNVCR
jgi:hypothetical protein